MARTKQTAQLVAQKIARKSAPVTTGVKGPQRRRGKGRGRSASSSSSSSSSSSVDVTRQQFSLKFDNQPDC